MRTATGNTADINYGKNHLWRLKWSWKSTTMQLFSRLCPTHIVRILLRDEYKKGIMDTPEIGGFLWDAQQRVLIALINLSKFPQN